MNFLFSMAQFLREIPEINPQLFAQIKTMVLDNTQIMQPSQLYAPAVDKKFIDVEQRFSVYRTFTQKELFDLCEQLVTYLSTLDPVYKYKLVRNDVTHIHYETGGFFNPHSDYLSLKSNMIEEFTCILCLQADCEGGRTIFHINEYFKHYSTNSKTTGQVLLFRKDLVHEGEKLVSGYKDIITLNLWAIIKDSTAYVITFPMEEKSQITETTKTTKTTDITSKSYVVPVSKILDLGTNFFVADMNFKIKQQKDMTGIYTHQAICTYEEFAVIDKILTGCYITIEEYIKHQELIDSYCIELKYILIDLTKKDPIKDTRLNQLNESIKKKVKSDNISNPLRYLCIHNFDSNKAICLLSQHDDNDNLYKLIKIHNLPLLPFKIVLVEGSLKVDDQERPHVYDMTPAYFSVGELNNLFFIRTLCNQMAFDTPFSTNSKYDMESWQMSSYLPTDNKNEIQTESEQENKDDTKRIDKVLSTSSELPTILKGKFTFSDGYDEPTTENYLIVDDCNQQLNDIDLNFEICKPELTYAEIIDLITESNVSICNLNEVYYADGIIEQDTCTHTQFYSISQDDYMYLNSKQAKYLKDKLISKSKYFMKKLKKLIKTTKFKIPQQKQTIDESFCNESVYGTCNCLYVTGYINLSHDDFK